MCIVPHTMSFVISTAISFPEAAPIDVIYTPTEHCIQPMVVDLDIGDVPLERVTFLLGEGTPFERYGPYTDRIVPFFATDSNFRDKLFFEELHQYLFTIEFPFPVEYTTTILRIVAQERLIPEPDVRLIFFLALSCLIVRTYVKR